MNKWTKSAVFAAGTLLGVGAAGLAQADIITTTPNGTVNGSVEGYDGWLFEDTFFGGIDFLVFETTMESLFSIEVDSEVDFGISVYEGLIENDTNIPFANDGDFFDFNSFLSYVGGTPVFAAVGSSLSDVLLSTPGWYTVAVGGDDIFGPQGSIAYTASLTSNASQVPVPAASFLLVAGLAALGYQRSRNNA